MSNPLVSICCITYNHADFLHPFFEGLLSQECEFNFEILIHDDSSTDGTKDIIKKYEQDNPDIVIPIFQKKNQWSQGVRNIQSKYNFSRAKGKYIALCEGDDYWTDPFKLQKQVDFLENNPSYSACFTNARVVKEASGEEKTFIKRDDQNLTYSIEDVIKRGGGMFPTATLVFKNPFVIQYPSFFSTAKSGDRALSLFLADKGPFYFLNEITCIYRIHQGGVFSSIKDDKAARKEKSLDNIGLLKNFNRYTNFQYNDIIKKTISVLAKSAPLKNRKKIFQKQSLEFFKELTLKDWLSLGYNFFTIKRGKSLRLPSVQQK